MKKGISLIVLVITIIIIIILAGAVILNLANNNPIESASQAAVLSEQSDINSGITLYLGSLAAQHHTTYTIAPADGKSANTTLKAVGSETALTTAEGMYAVTDLKITCGSETVEFATQQEFLDAIGMGNSSYASGTSPEYTVVMNTAGHAQLAK